MSTGTGSEPRQTWTLFRCKHCGQEEGAIKAGVSDNLDCIYGFTHALEKVEVEEVGSGHDEQAEASLSRLKFWTYKAKHGWLVAASVIDTDDSPTTFTERGAEDLAARLNRWQPDPRTVAAVVEALRDYPFGQGTDEMFLNGVEFAIGVVEQRFGSSVSGGE